MRWQISQMEKKCEEMETSIRIMNKSLASQEGAAKRSKVDLSEYSLQLEATEKINADLQRSLDSIIGRRVCVRVNAGTANVAAAIARGTNANLALVSAYPLCKTFEYD